MAKSTESQLTISCLQCDWSVDTVNTPAEVSRAFLKAARAHVDQHEHHALEIVQRLRLYSENYVELAPPPAVSVEGQHLSTDEDGSGAVEEEPAAQLQDMTFADVPEDARAAATRRDPCIQTGLLDRSRRDH